MDYLRDPSAIYAQSFATIRDEVDLDRFAPQAHALVVRLVHACGMVDIVNDLTISDGAIAAGSAALKAKAPIICDAQMVAHGIIARHVQSPILCAVHDERARTLAERLGTTRSAAGIEILADRIEGAVIALGNAPTALFHLLTRLDEGWPKPALILGFPVGFVGAAESKAELAANSRGVPFVTLLGRKGGSALAAAAVNALAVGLAT